MSTILTQLSTEPLAAERTWTVEEIPVLTASVSLPFGGRRVRAAARRIIDIPAAKQGFSAVLPTLASAGGGVGIPRSPGRQRTFAAVSGGADIPGHLQ
jgi:hypothetical protein